MFSRLPHIVAGKLGQISFTIDAANTTSLELLTACGMQVSTGVYTFTTDTTNYKTATLGVYHEGGVKTLAGAMGTFKLVGGARQVAQVQYVFTGIWQAPGSGAILNVPADVNPGLCNGGTFSWAGSTRVIETFEIDAGISVKPLGDMTNPAGYYRTWIDGRKVTGKCDPEISGVTEWSDYTTGTERALAIGFGTTPKHIAIAAAACQITDVSDASRNGVRIADMTVAMNGTSPLSITVS